MSNAFLIYLFIRLNSNIQCILRTYRYNVFRNIQCTAALLLLQSTSPHATTSPHTTFEGMIKGKIIAFLYSPLASFPFLLPPGFLFLYRLNVIRWLNKVHRLLHLPKNMWKYVGFPLEQIYYIQETERNKRVYFSLNQI
jgi:hypothetical protein